MNTGHSEEGYWQPRVMRHAKDTGEEEFAIHEVYFSRKGDLEGYTEDALSMREPTVARLREKITQLLMEYENGDVRVSDLGHSYSQEDIQRWLRHIDDPAINYEDGQISTYPNKCVQSTQAQR